YAELFHLVGLGLRFFCKSCREVFNCPAVFTERMGGEMRLHVLRFHDIRKNRPQLLDNSCRCIDADEKGEPVFFGNTLNTKLLECRNVRQELAALLCTDRKNPELVRVPVAHCEGLRTEIALHLIGHDGLQCGHTALVGNILPVKSSRSPQSLGQHVRWSAWS